MKNAKRILSTVMAFAIMLSFCASVQAAVSAGIRLLMEASREGILEGETVTLPIYADNDFISVGTGLTLFYDDKVLELNIEDSVAAEPFEINGPVSIGGRKAVRISFIPQAEAVDFSSEKPLAVLSFTALMAAAETSLSLENAYLYGSDFTEVVITKPQSSSITVSPNILVTGITLDKTDLSLDESKTAVITATVTPDNASDPTVIWTSSDETVAKVENGVVTALSEGEAIITAKTKVGGFTQTCTVTVTAPNVGYTVRMPANISAAINDTVNIPVFIGHTDEQTGYNAFDISLSYDYESVELVTDEIANVTVDTSVGRINIIGHGEEKSAGSSPFTLQFKVIDSKNAKIAIESARVDNSDNAAVSNASKANVIDGSTTIVVTGYPVMLPAGFSGAESVMPNTAYTFSEPNDYYDYDITVKVDGVKTDVTNNNDGTYTIPAESVMGDIEVTCTKTGKIFNVTRPEGISGPEKAQYGVDYSATVMVDTSYTYTVTGVTVGGVSYSGYTENNGKYTIPGEDITGDIIFTVTKEEILTLPVKFTGSAAGAASGNAVSVTPGEAYSFTLTKEKAYTYHIAYKMGSADTVTDLTDVDGVYTIENVTAPLEIIVTRTLDVQISVDEYINLDNKTVFLVLVKADPDSAKVVTYDRNPMFYSWAYNAWAWLTVVDDDFSLADAKEKISIGAGVKQIIEKPTGDVNATELIDINDAQLIYDLYNGKYENFDVISMNKFLNADVNGDRTVSVKDAAAVVAKIN